MIYWTVGENRHTYPLNHPRIGWRRITGTVAASTAAAGYAAANAATYRTDSFWRPTTSTGWWSVSATASRVSYCGIAAHDLGSKAATVVVEYYDGAAWVQIGPTVTPTDDSTILIMFSDTLAGDWRLRITAAGAAPTIGVIQFGAITEFPQKAQFTGSVPFNRARQVTFNVNMTEGGHYAGRSIQRVSLTPSMAVANLSETWIADEWDAFAAHAETSPFFIADRPEDQPESVAYAWTAGVVTPQRGVANAAVSSRIELSLTGFLA